jgi:cytochrome c biogenesis protein CcmG/thiol:disulfide interchange protein DsbE
VTATGTTVDEVTPAGGSRRRSHTVLWVCAAVAVALGAFIAVLASSKPSNQDNSSPLLNRPAPPVSGPAVNMGGSYALSQYLGKWVLVNFSASWCLPCRAETPQLEKFETEHAASGNAVILGVVFDQGDKSSLAAFLEASKATWPAVDDTTASATYGVYQLPESYLVDPSGRVVAKYLGGVTAAELDRVVDPASNG